MIDKVIKAANWLFDNGLDDTIGLQMAVVCGSGLSQAMDKHTSVIRSWNYADIPEFPRTSVSGHGGELIVAKFNTSKELALVFSGRIHLYEGITADELLFQVRLTKALHINKLVLTCSVGSLISETQPGSLGLISDHIDFQMKKAFEPQISRNESLYPIYDTLFSQKLASAALEAVIKLTPGVFCSVHGPTYETPAEVGMLKTMGCSWVSMSTTKEAAEGKRLGLEVAGITGISNTMKECYVEGETSHEEVLAASKDSSEALWKLLSAASFELG